MVRYGRKILQTNSSSTSFNPAQPAFIALYCIISLLTIALLITIIIFCYGYFSRRENDFDNRYRDMRRLKRRSVIRNSPHQPILPISMTPTSGSAYSTRSTEQLLSNRYNSNHTASMDRLPSRRFQQSMIDAYLNDLHSFQPSELDVEQLNSYLFVDLHSTSSETLPDNTSKLVNDNTIRHNTIDMSSDNEHNKKHLNYFQQSQQQGRSFLKPKQPYSARFVMRERSLPNNLNRLPELRYKNLEQLGNLFQLNDTNSSTYTTNTQYLQSSDARHPIHDDEDSHVYHVQRNQMMQMINEKKPATTLQHPPQPVSSPLHCYCNRNLYYFEKVSTSNADDSDIEVLYTNFPDMNNGSIYMNNTIIV